MYNPVKQQWMLRFFRHELFVNGANLKQSVVQVIDSLQ